MRLISSGQAAPHKDQPLTSGPVRRGRGGEPVPASTRAKGEPQCQNKTIP